MTKKDPGKISPENGVFGRLKAIAFLAVWMVFQGFAPQGKEEKSMKNLQKMLVSLAALGLLAAWPAKALAAEVSPYASFKASHSAIDADVFDYDNALGGKWAVGVSANVLEKAALRAELEYGDTSASYTEYSGRDNGDPHSNEDRAGQIDSKTLFLNFYFDIDTGTIFTPYIGAGLGVHNAALDYNFKSGRYSIPETRTSDWKFAWNVGAGVGVRVTQNLTLDLGYRYSDLGSFGMTAGLYYDDYNENSTYRTKEEHFDYDLKAHEVLLGLRYTF